MAAQPFDPQMYKLIEVSDEMNPHHLMHSFISTKCIDKSHAKMEGQVLHHQSIAFQNGNGL